MRSAPTLALTRARLASITYAEYAIIDGSAAERLCDVRRSLRTLAGSGDPEGLAALARDLIVTTDRARTEVIAFAARAVRTLAPGRSYDTEDTLARYTNACIGAEHAAIALHTAATKILREPERYAAAPVTVVLEGMDFRRCDALARLAEEYGPVRRLQSVPYIGVRCAAPIAEEMLNIRSAIARSGFAGARPARVYSVQPIPAVRVAGELDWNLELIGAERAWDRAQGSGTHVAIIDTGVDKNHHDLSGCFADGWGVDLVDSGEPMDKNGHGTHVAGTVAGALTGVAPNATLYAVRVLDEDGMGDEVTVLQGIEWAIQEKVDVINMSLGSAEPSATERKLVAIAASQGIAVACAAGNDGDSSYNYPASYPGAISVAAVDHRKQHAPFSNRNDLVSLCAPGVAIYSLTPGGGYTHLSGTSMATPHVAGACALLRSAGIRAGEKALQDGAENLGDRTRFGAGLIQLVEALQYGTK